MTTTEPAGPPPAIVSDIMENPVPDEQLVAHIIDLGMLSLGLGEAERATRHPGGKLPESVATHTVMVQVIACSLAEALNSTGRSPRFDLPTVCYTALFHDFPEVDDGDESTLLELTADRKAAKQAREQRCARRIAGQLGAVFPWFGRNVLDAALTEHMSLDERLVYFVDKFVPKIVHLACGCTDVIAGGGTSAKLTRRFMVQREQLRTEVVYDFPQVLPIFDILTARVIKELRRRGH